MFRDRVLKRKMRNLIFFILVVIIIISAYKNVRDSRADETTINYGERIFYFDAQFTDINDEENIKSERIMATSNLDGNYSVLFPKEIEGKKVLKYYLSNGDIVEIDQQNELENKVIVLSEEQIEGSSIVGSFETVVEDENTEIQSSETIEKKLGEFDSEKLKNEKIVIDNVSQNFAKDQTIAYITSIVELSKENISVLYNGENELEKEKFEIEKLEESIWKDVDEESQTYKIIINEASSKSVNQLRICFLEEYDEDEPIEVIINGNISNRIINVAEENEEELADKEKEENEEEQAVQENDEDNAEEENASETENEIIETVKKTEFVLFNVLKSTSEERTAESNFLDIPIERKNIQKIVFADEINDGIEEKYDISSAEDNSIIAWIDENIVYIYSENIINANYNSSFLFANINAPIEGLEKIYTYTTVNMDYMFKDYGNNSITELNLENNFDTSKVQTMRGMFKNCGTDTLEKINFSENFVTDNVTDMSEMFKNCATQGLVEIDLGNKFTTQNTTDVSNMFEKCGNNETTIYCGSKIFVSEKELKANLEKIQIPDGKVECKYYAEWQIELIDENSENNDEENKEEINLNDIENLEEGEENSENTEEINEENQEVDIGTEIYERLKTTNEENKEVIIYKLTANAVNTQIKEINLELENIKVLVDGEKAENITKELIAGEKEGEFFVILSNFEEKNLQKGKSFKEWSGNVCIKIDENTIIAENQNNNSETVSEEKFIDTIKPVFKITNAIMKGNTKEIEFSVIDKFFSQSTVSVDDITVLIDGEQIDLENFTRKISGEKIDAQINGETKTIGAQYKLTLTEKETENQKDNCFVTIAIHADLAEDTSGNKNIASTLTVEMQNEKEQEVLEVQEIEEVKAGMSSGTMTITTSAGASVSYTLSHGHSIYYAMECPTCHGTGMLGNPTPCPGGELVSLPVRTVNCGVCGQNTMSVGGMACSMCGAAVTFYSCSTCGTASFPSPYGMQHGMIPAPICSMCGGVGRSESVGMFQRVIRALLEAIQQEM